MTMDNDSMQNSSCTFPSVVQIPQRDFQRIQYRLQAVNNLCRLFTEKEEENKFLKEQCLELENKLMAVASSYQPSLLPPVNNVYKYDMSYQEKHDSDYTSYPCQAEDISLMTYQPFLLPPLNNVYKYNMPYQEKHDSDYISYPCQAEDISLTTLGGQDLAVNQLASSAEDWVVPRGVSPRYFHYALDELKRTKLLLYHLLKKQGKDLNALQGEYNYKNQIEVMEQEITFLNKDKCALTDCLEQMRAVLSTSRLKEGDMLKLTNKDYENLQTQHQNLMKQHEKLVSEHQQLVVKKETDGKVKINVSVQTENTSTDDEERERLQFLKEKTLFSEVENLKAELRKESNNKLWFEAQLLRKKEECKQLKAESYELKSKMDMKDFPRLLSARGCSTSVETMWKGNELMCNDLVVDSPLLISEENKNFCCFCKASFTDDEFCVHQKSCKNKADS